MVLSAEQSALVEQELPLVAQLASLLRRRLRLPYNVDKRELISAGQAALVDTALRFNPARGVPFGAFARMRVHGAMVDYLRDFLGGRRRSTSARYRSFVDVDDMTILDPATPVDERMARQGTLARLCRAIETLPQRERAIVRAMFWENVSGADVAKQLAMSESRLWQLRRRALNLLKDQIEADTAAA